MINPIFDRNPDYHNGFLFNFYTENVDQNFYVKFEGTAQKIESFKNTLLSEISKISILANTYSRHINFFKSMET